MQISQFYDWLKPFSQKEGISFELHAFNKFENEFAFTKKDKKAFSSQSQHLNLRVSQGEKTGFSYTKDFSRESLIACYKKAKDSLYFSENTSAGSLSEKQSYSQEQSFYNPDISSKEEIFKELETLHKVSSSFDKKVEPVRNTLKDEDISYSFINSLGTGADFKISNFLGYSLCMGIEGASRSQSYLVKTFKKLSQFEPEKLAEKIVKLTLSKLNSQVPESKKYPVLFTSEQSAPQLIKSLSKLLNAKSIYDKLSVLKKSSFNQKKFSRGLSLYDDPLKASGFCSEIFDGEGYASEKTTLIEDGVVKNFLSNSFYAKKMQIPHTKRAFWNLEGMMELSESNLIMKTGHSSFEEMLCEYPQVVVIDTLKSFAGYNPVSGDFSIESEGFLYEGEKLIHPLSQFTVSGNIIELFSNLSKIENKSHCSFTVECPSFLVHELNISGK